MHIDCAHDAHAQVGEGPVWDPAEKVLWWTDINGRPMDRFDQRDRTDRAFTMPVRVGCFALRRATNRPVVSSASGTGFKRLPEPQFAG